MMSYLIKQCKVCGVQICSTESISPLRKLKREAIINIYKSMSSPAQRRLMKDLQKLKKEAGDQIIAMPSSSNLLKWTATIEGIEGTAWEGGLYELKLEFTESYPNKPPAVKFVSEMFHPNIYNDGRICLDILQNQWSPVYDVWSILTAIRSLLADPNPLSPANALASSLFKDNRALYEKKVREIAQKSIEDEPEKEEEAKAEQNPRSSSVEEDELANFSYFDMIPVGDAEQESQSQEEEDAQNASDSEEQQEDDNEPENQ